MMVILISYSWANSFKTNKKRFLKINLISCSPMQICCPAFVVRQPAARASVIFLYPWQHAQQWPRQQQVLKPLPYPAGQTFRCWHGHTFYWPIAEGDGGIGWWSDIGMDTTIRTYSDGTICWQRDIGHPGVTSVYDCLADMNPTILTCRG